MTSAGQGPASLLTEQRPSLLLRSISWQTILLSMFVLLYCLVWVKILYYDFFSQHWDIVLKTHWAWLCWFYTLTKQNGIYCGINDLFGRLSALIDSCSNFFIIKQGQVDPAIISSFFFLIFAYTMIVNVCSNQCSSQGFLLGKQREGRGQQEHTLNRRSAVVFRSRSSRCFSKIT